MKLDEKAQLSLMPLCFTGKKYDAVMESIDGNTTVKSLFDKLKLFIRQETRPEDTSLAVT